MIARSAVVMLAALASGCTGVLNADLLRDEASIARDPAAPELALLEYRITRILAAQPAQTVCAGIRATTSEKVGPVAGEARLLQRFAGLSPLSRCRQSEEGNFDTETGAAAMIVDVHELKCEAPDNCTAWAGFVESSRRNGWAYFRATFANGAWRIREEDLGIVVTGAAS